MFEYASNNASAFDYNTRWYNCFLLPIDSKWCLMEVNSALILILLWIDRLFSYSNETFTYLSFLLVLLFSNWNSILIHIKENSHLLKLVVSFHRGFGFVTFADSASVDKVLMNGPHELDGKKVPVKLIYQTKY